LLPVGGTEERNVISMLDKWLETTQGCIRREAPVNADQFALVGQDLLDRLAIQFLLEVRTRDITWQSGRQIRWAACPIPGSPNNRLRDPPPAGIIST
jgi:hypothetical protein